jgi:hypothetical protein
MNSRYAPIVAITALAIIIVGALGVFLGIKPLLDSAASYVDREKVVRDNIALIEEDADKIDDAEDVLEDAPDLSEAIELNAPELVEFSKFEDRLAAAIRGSGSEVAAITVDAPADIIAWAIPDAVRPSANVAAFFQSAPLTRLEGEPDAGLVYVPVVQTVSDDASLAPSLVKVNVTITLKGTAAEIQAFLALLGDPAQRLFQVNDVRFEAKFARDTPLTGVSSYTDGDVVATVVGSLYLLNPTTDVEDEDELIPWTIPTDRSPFAEPDTADPQPGAN